MIGNCIGNVCFWWFSNGKLMFLVMCATSRHPKCFGKWCRRINPPVQTIRQMCTGKNWFWSWGLMVLEIVVFDDFPMEIDGFGNVCNLLQPKMFWGNDVAEFPGVCVGQFRPNMCGRKHVNMCCFSRLYLHSMQSNSNSTDKATQEKWPHRFVLQPCVHRVFGRHLVVWYWFAMICNYLHYIISIRHGTKHNGKCISPPRFKHTPWTDSKPIESSTTNGLVCTCSEFQ